MRELEAALEAKTRECVQAWTRTPPIVAARDGGAGAEEARNTLATAICAGLAAPGGAEDHADAIVRALDRWAAAREGRRA